MRCSTAASTHRRARRARTTGNGPAGDDGGYLASLVADVRGELASVLHYAAVRDALAQIAGYYAWLQTLKHRVTLSRREAVCSAWYVEHAESFPGLYWWEFAAACGSSLPVFALIYLALQPRIDARAIDSTVAACISPTCPRSTSCSTTSSIKPKIASTAN